MPQYVVVKQDDEGRRWFVQVSGRHTVHMDPRLHLFVAPGVIILMSTHLHGMFGVMQKAEHNKLGLLQKKFCTSMDHAHCWAVSSGAGCTILWPSFKKHKSQYVLDGKKVVHYNLVVM